MSRINCFGFDLILPLMICVSRQSIVGDKSDATWFLAAVRPPIRAQRHKILSLASKTQLLEYEIHCDVNIEGGSRGAVAFVLTWDRVVGGCLKARILEP